MHALQAEQIYACYVISIYFIMTEVQLYSCTPTQSKQMNASSVTSFSLHHHISQLCLILE